MRILIIGPGKLKYMPYLHFYLDSMDRGANDIHVAYWNRDEKSEDISSYNGLILHEFKCFMVNDAPLKVKFKMFKKYRGFCKEILKRNSFDRLIILHTLPGLMLFDSLVGRYKNKYILDYRDSTYETKSFFRFLVGRLVKCSYCTFVSSDDFRRYLPETERKKTYTSHNLLEDSLNHRDYTKIKSERIRLAFWGFVREIEVNKQIIDKISQDLRFELHFYGREQYDALELKKYTMHIGASNIFFHGEYTPDERYYFVEETDLIHNLFGKDNRNMSFAMSNKYYDSIIFRIPQVCQIGSFMGRMCTEHEVGIMVDPSEIDFCDRLYSYYKGLDWSNFIASCDKELDRVLCEYNKGKGIIASFLK